jgi:hypothetical protein
MRKRVLLDRRRQAAKPLDAVRRRTERAARWVSCLSIFERAAEK